MTLSAAIRARHLQWAKELTSIPTAAAREHRVVHWVNQWLSKRPNLTLRRDRYGNMSIRIKNTRKKGPVVLFTAHLDHPAFIVRDPGDGQTMHLDFRGGVHAKYFPGSPVTIFDSDENAHHGKVIAHRKTDLFDDVKLKLARPAPTVRAGDLAVWKLPVTSERNKTLRAPACDDLATVAAALAALDVLRKQHHTIGDVRALLTRCEEIGFIGAIRACQTRLIPRNSKVIALETSRSYADSPHGAGPILRVGDKMSVFHHGLLYEVARIAESIDTRKRPFNWQRKLMPGGTCEATTFMAFGYESICLCLPLGNYHNQGNLEELHKARPSRKPRIEREFINIDDYHGLVRWLIACGQSLSGKPVSIGESSGARAIYERMQSIIRRKGFVLDEPRARI